MWSRSELKSRAKEVLQLNYWKAVLVSLICTFLAGGGSGGSSSVSYSSAGNSSSSYSSLHSISQEEIAAVLLVIVFALIIFLLIFAAALAVSTFLFNPLLAGCYRFFINCRKGEANLNDVTFAFSSSYMNVVKIMFFRWLYTFLWSLLFLIPGYIKSYEYRMIPYLLAENPNISKEEAFRLSKEMMTGDKWNSFVLDLSFLGWNLLGALTCCILTVFYVGPYQNLTNAELYYVLKQKISVNTYQNPYL